MKTKYPALKRHICRFNDGESICECFDKGYKKAIKDVLAKQQENPKDFYTYLNNLLGYKI